MHCSLFFFFCHVLGIVCHGYYFFFCRNPLLLSLLWTNPLFYTGVAASSLGSLTVGSPGRESKCNPDQMTEEKKIGVQQGQKNGEKYRANVFV